MGRAKERADRIRSNIDLAQVLETYGYAVVSGADREQQFSCDLHGDGADSKPSARYYPDSNSWYCFACGRSSDAIATVMEKEGIGFSEACLGLEKQHGLPPLPWKDEDLEKPKVKQIILDKQEETLEELVRKTHRTLDTLTQDGTFGMDTALRLWEAFDRICYLHREQMIADDRAKAGLGRVAQRAMSAAEP